MHITWDEYFIGVAIIASLRSKDPNTKVGACIVNNKNRILSTGYNGFPNKCSDEEFPWGKSNNFMTTKYTYVVHAELNAILNCNTSLEDCTIYTTFAPCNECAKAIIQSGIKRVVYLSGDRWNEDFHKAARVMFESANIIQERIKISEKWSYLLKTLSYSYDENYKM